jgi:hypothetical protein
MTNLISARSEVNAHASTDGGKHYAQSLGARVDEPGFGAVQHPHEDGANNKE